MRRVHDQLLQRGVPFVDALRRHGARPALLAGDRALTYAELADRVDEAAAALGAERRLVVHGATNDVDSVVAYLAALRAGHPIVLAEPGRVDDLVARYGAADELHPELALLLSTSGSTGSPKLVRLSHGNLQSNADAVATSLDIRDDDVAALALPLHYCYGLSVLHSHLLRGAAVLLAGASVVDPCFWAAFRRHGATSLAGVPYTFELLRRVGFESMHLPTLRTVTQAGGRLAPDEVRRLAGVAREGGWRFVVMYGQTEATARMAYLPPELAESRPEAIGIAVPGGRLALDDVGDDGVGELVYTGPNVMLGYAEGPADLALGRTVDVLRTGDLARRGDDGLFEVVGRRSRFIKPFGVRVDLGQVERLLGEHAVEASCAGNDRRLVVATTDAARAEEVARIVRAHVGLPASAVVVVPVDELPRLANGKPDHAAVAALEPAPAIGRADDVHRLFAEVLGVDEVADDDTFASLGGDSLSYVEASIRLEALLGTLPPGWHTTPVANLRTSPGVAPGELRKFASSVETNVVLRAVAIVLVVGSHADLFEVAGGAHVLLAVAGFNYARFQLRGRRPLASIARIAVPSVLWIGGVVALSDAFAPLNALLLNNLLGPDPGRGLWGYWFIEAIVQLLLVLAVVGAVPGVRRFEAAHGWAAGLAVTAAGLALRFDVVPVGDGPRPIYMPHNVLWLFALGWLAERASTTTQRVAVSCLVVASVPGFFGDPVREALVAGGVLLLVWLRTLAVPRVGTWLVGVVAASSLFTYLTHWQVHVPLQRTFGPAVATLGSLVVGAVVWRAWTYGSSRVARSASTTSEPAPTSAA